MMDNELSNNDIVMRTIIALIILHINIIGRNPILITNNKNFNNGRSFKQSSITSNLVIQVVAYNGKNSGACLMRSNKNG